MLDVRAQLSGLDVHDALLERDAMLPVVYMSGHPTAAGGAGDAKARCVAQRSRWRAPAASRRVRACSTPPVPPARPATATTAQPAAQRPRRSSAATRAARVLSFVIKGIYNKNIADRIGRIKTVELYRARGMADARSLDCQLRMMVTHRV
jgi:two-component system response regulator FixJ